MRENIFILLALLLGITVSGQTIDQTRLCTYCKCDDGKCGPWALIDSIDRVIGNRLDAAPFPYILHIETHRVRLLKKTIDYGTVSFISPSCLLTAKHVVSSKGALKEIWLTLSTSAKDNWISLYKGADFEIVYYNDGKDVANDIAVVRILNKEKLAELYRGSFKPARISDSRFVDSDTVNVSGFSCYFANDPAEHDTLTKVRRFGL